MYLFFSRALYFRTAIVLGILLFGAVGKGYGQRVYADRGIVNEVYNPGIAGLLLGTSGVKDGSFATDINYNNFSQIGLALGVNSQAWQSLRFPDNSPLLPKSPIYIKFSPPQAVLSLLVNISVSRTKGDGADVVGTQYSNQQLLDLLGLLSANQPVIFSLPIDDVEFDGIRIKIDGTLATNAFVNYYYAFFIAPPTLESTSALLCQDQSAIINIKNFQTGYKYKIYTTETGGSSIFEATTPLITLPNIQTTGNNDYWIEAIDNDQYISARTPFTVTVQPKRPAPSLNIITNSQY